MKITFTQFANSKSPRHTGRILARIALAAGAAVSLNPWLFGQEADLLLRVRQVYDAQAGLFNHPDTQCGAVVDSLALGVSKETCAAIEQSRVPIQKLRERFGARTAFEVVEAALNSQDRELTVTYRFTLLRDVNGVTTGVVQPGVDVWRQAGDGWRLVSARLTGRGARFYSRMALASGPETPVAGGPRRQIAR